VTRSVITFWMAACVAAGLLQAEPLPTLAAQRAAILDLLRDEHGLSAEQLAAVERIFAQSSVLSQGNPAITEHPMTPDACRERRRAAGLEDRSPRLEAVCGAPFMAPLYDPATQTPAEAKACIDQYEFPDVPCSYPVVWVKASEAAEICEAMGKRLCDAHEWEGACAGALGPADYRFDLAAGAAPEAAVRAMRAAHNAANSAARSWSYGSEYRAGVCAAASHKSPACEGGSWTQCGSNTYPVGAFPECRSGLEVFDLNGNAAEHMNLPLSPDQMASTGSETLGVTEMKGSWFIFDSYKAHEDWCRWRAPFWHGTRVLSPHSHHNYHLGFRCCRSVGVE
jgi:Sulfatase-modifying factor enzyme 1